MFVPTTPPGLAADGLSIPNAADVILVVFLHGSEAEQRRDHCAPKVSPEGTVPPVIASLSGEVAESRPILVFAPCTKVRHGRRGSPEELKVSQRWSELEALLEQTRKCGYRPENTFLAGHSAGAWISFLVLAQHPGLVKGVIGFAPAFAGLNSGKDESNPFWPAVRKSHVGLIQSAASLPSLIFSFQDDEFEPQAALREVFGNVRDARLVEMDPMPAKMWKGATEEKFHCGAYNAAFLQQKDLILQFIKDRLKTA
jgi:pimeloyl-ACP methyl ester carboxylesterase